MKGETKASEVLIQKAKITTLKITSGGCIKRNRDFRLPGEELLEAYGLLREAFEDQFSFGIIKTGADKGKVKLTPIQRHGQGESPH